MSLFFVLLAIAAGAANPFQAGVNAELNNHMGRPLWTGMFVYATGLAGLLLLQFFVRQPLPGNRFPDAPWWAWVGGIVSIVSTVIGLSVAQKLGSGVFTGVSVTTSLVVSVLLDQFGLVGFKQHTASPMRLVGCTLLVAGVWLVARF